MDALITIAVPLDREPIVIDDGGLASYLVYAALMEAAGPYQTTWVVTPAEEED